MLCGKDMQSVMAREFEKRQRSYYDRVNESRANSKSLEVPRETTEEEWEEERPSESQCQESSTVPGDEKDEYLALKAEISLKYIGNLLELFETLLKQLQAEKEYSGKNEESSKNVDSCACSGDEVCGLIGNFAQLDDGHRSETSDDSFSSSETEQPGWSTTFAEADQDPSQEVDWSVIDKEMESLTVSFEVEPYNFNEEVGYSCGEEQTKSWKNSLEVPQDHSSQEVDWSFDDDHLKSGTNSLDTSRENSNEESKRTIGDVTVIRHAVGESSSCSLQCGHLFDEYISNLCKCFKYSIEGETAWKTTAGNDWSPGGTWEISNHSSGVEKVESPSAKSFGIYPTYSGPGGESFPDADTSSKSCCYQSVLLPSQTSPSTPNPIEAPRSPVSAKIEVCDPPGVFEALSSVTDEFYSPVEAAAGTYGPIGTPTTVAPSCGLRRRTVMRHD